MKDDQRKAMFAKIGGNPTKGLSSVGNNSKQKTTDNMLNVFFALKRDSEAQRMKKLQKQELIEKQEKTRQRLNELKNELAYIKQGNMIESTQERLQRQRLENLNTNVLPEPEPVKFDLSSRTALNQIPIPDVRYAYSDRVLPTADINFKNQSFRDNESNLGGSQFSRQQILAMAGH